MLRALSHATTLWLIGQLPRGPRAYHALTCGLLGSQAFHPKKLAGVWPRYAELVAAHGQPMEGARVWVHEAGWTPFSALAAYLLSGRGATLTNGAHVRVLDRYVRASVEAALAMPLGDDARRRARREALAALGAERGARCLVDATGGTIFNAVAPTAVPLDDASIDLVHSGNALEHYPAATLRGFLAEQRRILRPGALASHVVDHRDHLCHVDPRWPTHAHLAWSDAVYGSLFGHPLLHHNRLSPTELRALFEGAGFEVLAVRRAGEGRVYVDDAHLADAPSGVPSWADGPRARSWSHLDQRTAYAHYLLRRR